MTLAHNCISCWIYSIPNKQSVLESRAHFLCNIKWALIPKKDNYFETERVVRHFRNFTAYRPPSTQELSGLKGLFGGGGEGLAFASHCIPCLSLLHLNLISPPRSQSEDRCLHKFRFKPARKIYNA